VIAPDFAKRGAQAAALVTSMTLSTLLLGGLGWYVDGRFSTAPIGLLLGGIVGFSAGLYRLLQGVTKLAPPHDDHRPPDPPQ